MTLKQEITGYFRFLRQSLHVATDGGRLFYAWMFVLTCVALVGANAWSAQVRDGMIRTQMTDHVSWGLSIANFTFCVGLAAGGVMMVNCHAQGDGGRLHESNKQ